MLHAGARGHLNPLKWSILGPKPRSSESSLNPEPCLQSQDEGYLIAVVNLVIIADTNHTYIELILASETKGTQYAPLLCST